MMEKDELDAALKDRTARRIMRREARGNSGKNGIVYVLLAFGLCVIGAHNFYAGYVKKGMVQLLLTIISPLFLFLPLLLCAVWGVAEMLFVNRDAKGRLFGGDLAVIWGLRLLGVGVLAYSLANTELIL